MPDDALLTRRPDTTLTTADGLATQAQTMLDATPARTVFQRFHTELFGLDRYRAIEKDATAYPSSTPQMDADLQAADTMFFDTIFSTNKGFREILLTNIAFVNQATAPLYGMTATGTTLKQVTVGAEPAGLLHAGRLPGLQRHAEGSRSDSPRRRHHSPRDGQADLAPPAGIVIPPLPGAEGGPDEPRAGQRPHRHRHLRRDLPRQLINPVGFAFENFDTVGKLRTMDNGKPVDTTGDVRVRRRDQVVQGRARAAGADGGRRSRPT